ncbi:DUF2790 domain-containing protein [Ectopseudomonas hydrolytica]|jgi:hypothetical protein|uniref:DUF2790 domain-containing protein n=1 Tax=Ectopseudomonas hydrolytica TaxID=2493633 RepID=UPI0018A727FA|nr:DUF2790 domain-containing protein [Pseudomonas hydrolytica]MBF8160569.1 DUF2790 domain-containing protein [Pseudomonas mendocina]UTH33580.1 DUF2790 domain-containing protein [Pseudomonas hydrolytica]UZZ12851.1 DUF2790 domain-containing protein [Pseudomonas mendocina]
MKARTLFATALTALSLSVSLGAFAQSADATQYRYGLDLDIAKVISIEVPNSPQCEVVTAKMTYRNSAGEVETLSYEQLSNVCANQN